MSSFMYDYVGGLYFNLTNRCPCSCGFCVRSKVDSLGSADNLWLDKEPSADEVIAAIQQTDLGKYSEAVFCGYGEPLVRLEELLVIADYIKEVSDLPVRVNTNGLGNLIHGRDVVREIAGHVDAVSVSLNAPDSKRYVEICRPEFGEAAYEAMLEFARAAVRVIGDVTMSVVDVISEDEIAKCSEIARKSGAKFRVRGCY